MTSINNSGALQSTWFGHVANTRDALILFEACLNGNLQHVPRRPHDRERSTLIRSGSVFIYEENASGIKRWTDGVPWSPSRILGNFLVYRELLKPFPPGEKKRANRKKRPSKPGEPYPRPGGETGNSSALVSPSSPETPGTKSDGGYDAKDSERALIGSLVDSYGFKEGGLVKKTMSVNVHGVHHHLVSYYTIKEVMDGELHPPTQDPRLSRLEPRPDLITRQNFRAPLDDADDSVQEHSNGPHLNSYGYESNPYDRKAPALLSQGLHANQPQNMISGYFPNGLAYPNTMSLHHGVQGYPSVPTATPFYSGSQSTPQPAVLKQEEFGAYSRPPIAERSGTIHGSINSISERSSSQAHMHYFDNRHQSMPELMHRSNGTANSTHAMQDSRSLEAVQWRTGVGAYAPTAPHPVASHDGSSPYNNTQHWSMTNGNYCLPRTENMYYDHQNWALQSPMNGRQQSFQGQVQHQ